jgi:hypothetical protein
MRNPGSDAASSRSTRPSDVIGAAWREYRTMVIPLEASPIQILESQRAFYAGANALLVGVIKILDPGADVTDADLARLDAIYMELKQFARDILEGPRYSGGPRVTD